MVSTSTLERDYNCRRLRHLLTLQQPSDEHDFGGRRDWQDVEGTSWAEITPRAPTEVVAGQRVEGLGTHTIRIRYRSVQSSWRLLEKKTGRVFAIKGIPINVEERDHWLDIPAVEVESESRTT